MSAGLCPRCDKILVRHCAGNKNCSWLRCTICKLVRNKAGKEMTEGGTGE